MNTFVTGDIHGNYKALKQCLERSNFDYEQDTLISLGDVCDGFLDTYKCIEELLKIRNLIKIKGNHDDWFLDYIETGIHPTKWRQGGVHTAESYLKLIAKEYMIHPSGDGYVLPLNPGDIPEEHKDFFRSQVLYYIDDENRCFVHGGFNRHFPFKEQMPHIYYWDRDLWTCAKSYESMKNSKHMREYSHGKFKMATEFKEIFIGHTATTNWEEYEGGIHGGVIVNRMIPITKPMKAANIYNIDTGAGFDGKLTFMNVETKEIFQSDLCKDLYPEFKPR